MTDQICWPPGTPHHLTVPTTSMGTCPACQEYVHLATHPTVCIGPPATVEAGR